ncbi:MAG: YncE family protein [Polyangiaceae bacterium]
MSQGNSIAKIDPMSATVLQTVYVGPSPSRVALSDDGNTLWVVLSGSSSVRRVDLTTFTAGSTIALRPGTGILGIQVLAGTEDSVAVTSSEGYPYGYSVAIYDNGAPRPYGADLPYQATVLASASAALLFEAPNGYPYYAYSICADSNGAFLRSFAGLVPYSGTPAIDRGVLYNTDGSVYDAESGTHLHDIAVPVGGYTVVTADENDVYYLTSTYESSSIYWIQVTGFDRATYAATTTDLLQTNAIAYTTFRRWGRYGLAYITSNPSIEIARSTIIPDMP